MRIACDSKYEYFEVFLLHFRTDAFHMLEALRRAIIVAPRLRFAHLVFIGVSVTVRDEDDCLLGGAIAARIRRYAPVIAPAVRKKTPTPGEPDIRSTGA